MGEKELRAKYGGKLAKALNRAIRAECPDGNNALDRLTKLAGQASGSGWTLPNGQPTDDAKLYEKHQRQVVARLEAEVRARWGIPPDENSTPAKKGRQTVKSARKKKPAPKRRTK